MIMIWERMIHLDKWKEGDRVWGEGIARADKWLRLVWMLCTTIIQRVDLKRWHSCTAQLTNWLRHCMQLARLCWWVMITERSWVIVKQLSSSFLKDNKQEKYYKILKKSSIMQRLAVAITTLLASKPNNKNSNNRNYISSNQSELLNILSKIKD